MLRGRFEHWIWSAAFTFGAYLETNGSLQPVILEKSDVPLRRIRDFGLTLCACRSPLIDVLYSQQCRYNMSSIILTCCNHGCHRWPSSNQAPTPSAFLPSLVTLSSLSRTPGLKLDTDTALSRPRPRHTVLYPSDRHQHLLRRKAPASNH